MQTYSDWPDTIVWELKNFLREKRPAHAQHARSNADLVKLLFSAKLVGHTSEPAGHEGISVYDYHVEKINAMCTLIITTNEGRRGGPTVFELFVYDE